MTVFTCVSCRHIASISSRNRGVSRELSVKNARQRRGHRGVGGSRVEDRDVAWPRAQPVADLPGDRGNGLPGLVSKGLGSIPATGGDDPRADK
jgi:hypothetical protein